MSKFVTPISDFAKGMIIGGAIVAAMIWFIIILGVK